MHEVKQRKRFFYVSIIILSMIILAVSIMAYRYYQRQRSMSAELEALIRKIASEEQKADRLFRPL